jgi:hypothetical protein
MLGPSGFSVPVAVANTELTALGREHRMAWDLDKAVEKQANDGQRRRDDQLRDDEKAGAGAGQ